MSVSRLAVITKRRTSLAGQARFQRSIIHRLDASVGGKRSSRVPGVFRGYAALSDQLRRALLFLGIAEA